MLNEILGALGGDPAQTLPEDTTGRQFLLNEIEAAMNKNKWENDTNYFLVVQNYQQSQCNLAEPYKNKIDIKIQVTNVSAKKIQHQGLAQGHLNNLAVHISTGRANPEPPPPPCLS